MRRAALTVTVALLPGAAVAYGQAPADPGARPAAGKVVDRVTALSSGSPPAGTRCRLEARLRFPATRPYRYRARIAVEWRQPGSRSWHRLALRRVTRRGRPSGQPPQGASRVTVSIPLGSAKVRRLIARGARFRVATAHRVTAAGRTVRRERARHALRLEQCEVGPPIRGG